MRRSTPEQIRAWRQRSKPLDRRRAPLRSTGFGKRGDRKPLKTSTWKAPASLTKTGICANCGAEGPTDFHHIIPRSLSRIGRDDPRNLLELDRHCHNAWHAGTPIRREAIPAENWVFLEEIAPSIGWLARRYPTESRRVA